AYTAVHWPLQAPQPSIERFQGNYDDGYDVLHTNRIQRLKSLGLIDENVVPYPKLAEVPAWDSLSAEEQQNSARMMEIYAAMTSDIDQYIGELIAYLESIDEFD
ncbi:MAG: arylsulfatase, partial [Woeseiales bacterium]